MCCQPGASSTGFHLSPPVLSLAGLTAPGFDEKLAKAAAKCTLLYFPCYVASRVIIGWNCNAEQDTSQKPEREKDTPGGDKFPQINFIFVFLT